MAGRDKPAPRARRVSPPGVGTRAGRPARYESRREGPSDDAARRPRVKVIFEDDHVIAINKPLGLSTALMPGERGTSAALVLSEMRRSGERPIKPWILHRLDREATGVVVFAKSKHAYEALRDAFRGREVLRQYVALVEGEVSLSAAATSRTEGEAQDDARDDGVKSGVFGTISTLLVETREGTVKSFAEDAYRPGVSKARKAPPRKAVTHYEVLAVGRGMSLLRVMTRSGHKHQVRAQLAGIGHPAAGDRAYGATSDPLRRVGLHATEIAWPGTTGRARAACAAPAAFYRAVGAHPPAGHAAMPEADDHEPRPGVGSAARSDDSTESEGWEHVAQWYDAHLTQGPSDLYQEVVLPGVLSMLNVKAGERVLDVACGQGWLARLLADDGAVVTGVDASPSLIEAAKRHGGGGEYVVGDARDLGAALGGGTHPGPFEAASCVMALMNMDPMEPVLAGVAERLAPGGRFVAVILHPAFRSPGRTSWGWDRAVQYRRVEAYLTPGRSEIVMNPGAAAHGAEPVHTRTYHRPIGAYVGAYARAGLLVEAMEEWASHRRSEPGPRAASEDRARREIPMFLAIRAVKR